MRSHQARLKRLEDALGVVGESRPVRRTDQQWVDWVVAWSQTADLSTEPDFAATLATARESVSRGECQIGGDSPLVRLLKMTRRVMRGQESSTPA